MSRRVPRRVTRSTKPDALDDRAVGRVVAVADELEPRAHREHHGAARVRARPIAARDARMPVGGHQLRVVLAAAEEVDVERVGDRRAGVDLDELGRDAAPPAALHEHDRVAAVAVGPEQLGVDEADRATRRTSPALDRHRSGPVLRGRAPRTACTTR